MKKSFALFVSALFLLLPTTGFAQATTNSVGGANPRPGSVGGANPRPTSVGGANPRPSATSTVPGVATVSLEILGNLPQ